MWFELTTGSQGKHAGFLTTLPRCGAEAEEGGVELESCQQSNVRNAFILFMTVRKKEKESGIKEVEEYCI